MSCPNLLACLAVGIGMVLSVVGCDQDQRPVDVGDSLRAAWSQRCARTGGTWYGGRLACMCVGEQLFDPDAGCTPVTLVGASGGDGDATGLGSDDTVTVVVGARAMDEASTGAGLAAVWRILSGRTVSRREARVNFLPFRPMSSHVYHMGLGQLSRYPWARPPLQHLELPSRGDSIRERRQFEARCLVALQTAPPASGEALGASAAGHLCAALGAGWSTLADDGACWESHDAYSDEGDDCAHSCAMSTLASHAGYALRTSITMQNMRPIARSVAAWGPNNVAAILYLSPQLDVEAVEWRQLRAASDSSDLVLSYAILDGRLDVMDWGASIVESANCRIDFQRAMLSSSRVTEEPWPTRVMLLEDRLSCQATYLADAYDGCASEWDDEPSAMSLYGSEKSVAADLLTEGDSLDGLLPDHAADMAELITATNPRVRFSVLPKRDLVYHGAESAVASWARAISTYRPRVVNISQVFSRLLPNCHAAFAPLFDSFPDVLFVIGVGNSGVSDGINLCPSGVAASYPNVITVAGHDGAGNLSRWSNRGTSVAMVAALGSARVTRGGVEQADIYGTSVAAALVSRQALMRLDQSPSMCPLELIGEFMDSCTDDGLNVACGGRVR